jgi:hypothetical protein
MGLDLVSAAGESGVGDAKAVWKSYEGSREGRQTKLGKIPAPKSTYLP